MDPTTVRDDRVGMTIAERYRLDEVIGKGGMGTVYQGVHLWTERPLAVKLLYTDQSETMDRRILSEARAAAAVRHPHLVEVLDVGAVEPGVMYLVLELLEGETLYGHLHRKGKMRPEDAVDVCIPILDALGALHRASIIHRDVKPGNIFLSNDGSGRVVPKLLDLGISKRLDVDEALTVTGALMGTPSYMSPEQARGMREIGPSADVWAMGVVLFECLTGERPFDHPTIPGLLHQIATESVPPIATLVDGLPGPVADAIDGALARDVGDRHDSAAAMTAALAVAATDAGWSLSSRIASGPSISLVPEESDIRPPIDPLGQTHASDPGSAPTPYATPPVSGAVARPSSRTAPPPEPGPERATDPEPEPAPPTADPVVVPRPPVAAYVGGAAALLLLAAAIAFFAWPREAPPEPPDPTPAATEPESDPDPTPDPDPDPDPATPDPDPDPEPATPDPTPTPDLDPTPDPTPNPAATRRRRPTPPPTPQPLAPEPTPTEPEEPSVQEGANRAPIILD